VLFFQPPVPGDSWIVRSSLPVLNHGIRGSSDNPHRGMARAVLALALAAGCLGIHPAVNEIRAESVSYGTGFFVHPDGFLLTNQHVIEDADEVFVITSEAKKLPARVVKADVYKDLALIKVDILRAPHLALGRSADVKVLEPVIAVGFPYADKIEAELSAYDGKINAIRDSGPIPLLQIDANVNPGNSGGPVFERSRRGCRNRGW
jgi:S1-C subfamily serine protease